VFAKLSDNFSLGGRLAYHHWTMDADGWFHDFFSGGGYTLESSSGSQDVFEIVPALRFATGNRENPVQLFIHAGIGIYVLSPSEIKIRGSFHTPTSSGWTEKTIMSSTTVGFGGQVGFPIVFSDVIELTPLYSPYMMGGDLYHFFSVNIGIIVTR
jgi:hypothetical protein